MKTKRTIFLTLLFTLFILIVASCQSDNQEESIAGTVWIYSAPYDKDDPYDTYDRVCIFGVDKFEVYPLDINDKAILFRGAVPYYISNGKLYIDSQGFDLSSNRFTFQDVEYVRTNRKPTEFFR